MAVEVSVGSSVQGGNMAFHVLTLFCGLPVAPAIAALVRAGQVPCEPALQGAVPHRVAEQGTGEGVQEPHQRRIPREHVRGRGNAEQ